MAEQQMRVTRRKKAVHTALPRRLSMNREMSGPIWKYAGFKKGFIVDMAMVVMMAEVKGVVVVVWEVMTVVVKMLVAGEVMV